MNRLSRSISLIIRSERLMAERRMAVAGKQTGLLAFGIFVAAIGVVMLTAAAYLALAEWLGPPLAALIVSLVDFALAAALVMIASNQSAEDELKPVMEARDFAADDLNQELQFVTQEARAIGQTPLGLANSSLITPLLKALRKKIVPDFDQWRTAWHQPSALVSHQYQDLEMSQKPVMPVSVSRWCHSVWLVFAALLLVLPSVTVALAQETAGTTPSARQEVSAVFNPTAVRTESPYQTLSSFRRLTGDLEATYLDYERNRDAPHLARVVLVLETMISLFDLSQVPDATRRYVGYETLGHVLDILGRVDPIDLEVVPDAQSGTLFYSIPQTPLRLSRVKAGSRTAEVLFDPQTVTLAPRFNRGISESPLRSNLEVGSWHELFGELTGPLIPEAVVGAVPDGLHGRVFDTPLWKVLVLAMAAGLGLLALILLRRLLHLFHIRNPILRPVVAILGPLAFILIVRFLHWFALEQLNTVGQLSFWVANGATVLVYLAATLVVWQIVRFGFEVLISNMDSATESLDANMIRLIGRIVAAVVAIIVLAYGGQAIGLPIFSILAGLGIGGIAIALAIRPTLENLIGGFILYIDKPIRVGDFCTFGDQSGTIENIGVRSTQIRALDRTLITVPNAQFADMQIINWARCDMMIITHTLGLRYETDPDQLRHVLAKLREMMHGHPRIDSDTVRVRFAGYGASSLDIAIRVYATTREWNEFHAIREDVFLRIYDIVRRSGTGFAFPSQTLYMARDDGLDADLAKAAKAEVGRWRRDRSLPFPRFAADTLSRLDGRLSYPSPGSPDFNSTEEELAQGGEGLSAAPPPEDSEESDAPAEKTTKA